jgi:STE24 endopeptidase
VDGSTRSSHSNAYLYGFGNNKRIVLYDTLIAQLNEEEIVSVLAHELGHWSMWHTAQGFVITGIQMFAIFSTLGQFLNNTSMYHAFGFSSQPTIVGVTLFLNVVWSPISFVLNFFMNMYSRKNEFEADAYATKLGK